MTIEVSIRANSHLDLGLSPEAGTVGSEPDAGNEMAEGKVPVFAENVDLGIALAIPQGIVALECEASPVDVGHRVLGIELKPFSTRTDGLHSGIRRLVLG